MDHKLDEHLGEVDEGRRVLLKRLIASAAFAAPVLSIYGVGPANAQVPGCLLSNSFGQESPGGSRFGTTQNRDNCGVIDDQFPEGLQSDPAAGRFPRMEETLDKHGGVITPIPRP